MATTKKTPKAAVKKVAKKAKIDNRIILDDSVLWAVLKRGWFTNTVHSVYTTRREAEQASDLISAATLGTYVVQRAPLVITDKGE